MSNKEDISERVFITSEVFDGWAVKALEEVRKRPGIKPSEISEEIIYLNPDQKTLTLSAVFRGDEVSMIIPPGQWRWNTGSAN